MCNGVAKLITMKHYLKMLHDVGIQAGRCAGMQGRVRVVQLYHRTAWSFCKPGHAQCSIMNRHTKCKFSLSSEQGGT
jgi:hypothetical protein